MARNTVRTRGGCCRFYLLPEGEYCATCVLHKPRERDQRLHTFLLEKLADES